jgi:hypothetical protein
LRRAGCDLTVLLMCTATVWETLSRLHSGQSAAPSSTDGRIDSFWDVVELVFTVFFALEVMLKVVVFGWQAYWRDFTNRCAAAVQLPCMCARSSSAASDSLMRKDATIVGAED